MQHYLSQLLNDIHNAQQNLVWPSEGGELSLFDWKSPSEEENTAPVWNLSEWVGITTDMLPPSSMLSNEDIHRVLEALKDLLGKCNCHVVFPTEVPERIQYEAIRQNFGQEIKIRQWHFGLFAFCKRNTPLRTCTLGEYCQCAFYEELFSDFEEEDLSSEEERERALEFEIRYLKRKYDDDWIKYYPYHLDKNYDDENGNPYNYDFGDDEDDEEDDTWWRR